ncbi:DUF1697 domain-containing protein [Subtercola endophyticus]|uniref:DUF1697 domain-containing protein n=1 Tax=Subtercola endophyticus TaxID=2895559 RepID=UPI001E2A9850|nr:DUF1697 domain-containing protein [Subtercola endophyticus]UFS60942.1 DUF1697 domain-containing protein [Subtercola endophyticus]
MPEDVYVHVALARGINVGTSHQVTMDDLRGVFENLGYTGVRTLLRSGNVVFSAAAPIGPAEVTAIEAEFERVAGFTAGFVVLSGREFLEITNENPLLDIAVNPAQSLVAYVPPTADARSALAAEELEPPDPEWLAPEVMAVGKRAVYLWCPNGVSKSKVPAAFWKRVGPVYTARNLNTTSKLSEMVRARLLE